MADKIIICSECGKETNYPRTIEGYAKKYEGKVYCYDCIEKLRGNEIPTAKEPLITQKKFYCPRSVFCSGDTKTFRGEEIKTYGWGYLRVPELKESDEEYLDLYYCSWFCLNKNADKQCLPFQEKDYYKRKIIVKEISLETDN